MDLRVQKTKNAIINAFFSLRQSKPINRITVTELARKAMISKATFYLHYKDIYDLSEQLQNELVSDIIKEIPCPEKIITETEKYTHHMITAFLSKISMIDILFPGEERNRLASRIEYYIKKEIYIRFPHLKNNIKTDITLTFLIQGGFFAYSEFGKIDFEASQQCICELSKLAVEHMLDTRRS